MLDAESTQTEIINVDRRESNGSAEAQHDFHPGDRIGPYEILERIGRGGMGVVYKARVAAITSLPRHKLVALKMLRISDIHSINYRRFRREAGYLLALNHPGIVKLYSLEEHDGFPYLVMELVQGNNLDDLMPSPAVASEQPEAHICDVLIQALEALHTAHLAGILHRDLKPGNLMISPQGRVMILDFGMAQRPDDDSRLTASGSVLGTPAYMSPEQARGAHDEIDQRSDIYSLGAVLYELSTGYQPFSAENSVALLRAILEEPLTPPSTYRPAISRDLETVILRAMAKDPRDRYANAEEMAVDLRRIRGGQRIRSRRPRKLLILARKLHYHRKPLAIAGLVAFALLTGLTIVGRHALDELAKKRRLEQRHQEMQERLQAEWITDWDHSGRVLDSPRVTAEINAGFDDELLILTPLDLANHPLRISSDIRIKLQVFLIAEDPELHVYFSNRRLGEGYGLRLRPTTDDTGRLLLELTRHRQVARQDRTEPVVARSQIIAIPADGSFELTLKRDDNRIVVSIDGRSRLDFEDLFPLSSPVFNGVYLALKPDTVRLEDLLIERHRRPELVNRIELADTAYFDGNYERARQLYQDFLRDFPYSDQAPSARYRIARCLFAQADYANALEKFRTLAAEGTNSRYHLPAVFQAWICALYLNRLQDAERFYESIREQRENKQVMLTAVPEHLLRDLPRTYLRHGDSLAADHPDRAKALYESAVEIARFLQQPDVVLQGKLDIASIHLRHGILPEAERIYREAIDEREHDSSDLLVMLLKLAEVKRLRGDVETARSSYRRVIAQTGRKSDLKHWAYLWLGDLELSANGLGAALDVWQEAPRSNRKPSRIIAHLLDRRQPLPDISEDTYRNDLIYFMAQAERLDGRPDRVFNLLNQCLDESRHYEWPAPLVTRQLREFDTGPPR